MKLGSFTTIAKAARTFRYLRAAQAVAQVRHLLLPAAIVPIEVRAAPELCAEATLVPFLVPSAHARAETSGNETRIRLIEREVAFRGGLDWDYHREGALFAYQLHHFDWARCEGLDPAVRAAWMLDWVDDHRAGIGWDPHPTSHRILAWGKLLLTPGALAADDAARAVLLRSLASQIETLSHNLEVRLQANHLFTNLLAVVFGGLLLEGPESRGWLRRCDALRGELRDQIHPDGAHEERSPMYHALLLEQVLDLLNLAHAVPERSPPALVDDLEDVSSRMCGALEVWTHPDGEIALFADSAIGMAQTPASLDEYAAALGIAVHEPEHPDRLDCAGYVRVADDDWHVLVSTAGPAPDHLPGHAHCDALSFELSVGGQRVVTDTGVFEYIPGASRDVARATRSHATIEIDGREQAELWAAHRVGGRPLVRVIDVEPGQAVEASCQSWSTRDVVHRRRFELSDGRLDIHDYIEGPRRVPIRLSLPLAPGLGARLVGEAGEAQTLHVDLDAGRALEVALPAPGRVAWRLEPSDYFERFGKRLRRWTLVGESADYESGVWRFRC